MNPVLEASKDIEILPNWCDNVCTAPFRLNNSADLLARCFAQLAELVAKHTDTINEHRQTFVDARETKLNISGQLKASAHIAAFELADELLTVLWNVIRPEPDAITPDTVLQYVADGDWRNAELTITSLESQFADKWADVARSVKDFQNDRLGDGVVDRLPVLIECERTRLCESGDGDAILSPADIAKRYGVDYEPLRRRLERWRKKHDDGWIEDENRTGSSPKYLYRVSAVSDVILAGKTSTSRPSKKN